MRLLKLVILTIVLVVATTLAARAEYIFLKDGSVIKGTIIRESAAQIFLRTEQGQKVFGRGAVMRILYTDLYLGKRFVRLSDGDSFEAYLVDEDAKTYTFRKNLNSTKEFTIRRDLVLFMSLSNPTVLRGQVYAAKVKLKWYPPYRKPKKYNIYGKIKKRGAKWEFVGSSRGTSHTVSGLERKTSYSFRVTAIDREGVESTPSNEIFIKTNEPPTSPSKPKIEKIGTVKLKTDVKISWQPSLDPDGKVEKYTVYQEIDKKQKKIGDTNVTQYTVKDLDSDKVYRFAIAAVDNDNTESPEPLVVSTRDKFGFAIQVEALGILPLRDMFKLYTAGTGALATVYVERPLINKVQVGLSTGYLHFFGKRSLIDSFSMVPILADLRVRFDIKHNFYLAPRISLGYSFNTVKYQRRYTATDMFNIYRLASSRTDSLWQPFGMIGVMGGYEFGDTVCFTFGAEYGAIIEQKGIMDMVSVRAGVAVRL